MKEKTYYLVSACLLGLVFIVYIVNVFGVKSSAKKTNQSFNDAINEFSNMTSEFKKELKEFRDYKQTIKPENKNDDTNKCE